MKVIVDSDFLLFVCSYSKVDEELKTLEESLDKIDHYINQIFQETDADEYILCLTKNAFRRYNFYSEYKSNRKGKEKPLWFNEMRDYIIKEYNCACDIDGYESDDFCASYAKLYSDAVICHTDKDMLQIKGVHYNPRTKEFLEVDEWEAHRHFFRSMLIGDSADAIQGVKGIGKVGAEKLISLDSKDNIPELVLTQYISSNHSVDRGIEEFYKAYKLLKLVEDIPNLPELKKIV